MTDDLPIRWHAVKVVDKDDNRSTSYISDDERYRIDPIFRAAMRGPNGRVRDGYSVEGLTIEGRHDSELGYKYRFDTLALAKERCQRDNPNEKPRR